MKTNKKILTIGGATQDLFINYENPESIDLKDKTYLLLEQGSKLNIQSINYYTGGGATNTGVSFKRLGFDVTAFFKIAKDSQGDFILNELTKENLTTKVTYSKTMQTAVSFILPTPLGDRIILALRGANKDITLEELPIDQIKTSDQLYITSLTGNSAKLLPDIIDLAKQNNIPIAFNPGINQLKKENINESKQILKNIDTLILNTKEATQLLNSLDSNQDFSFTTYFNNVLKLGPKIAVVTDGANGVYVATPEKIHFQKSIPSKAVSTLGAGDAFGSCFIASILTGKSIEQAALYGAINAASVIEHEGAKTGLLTWQEIEVRAKLI